jgi:hypothetical protein
MDFTFNPASKVTAAGRSANTHRATLSAPYAGGLLISPESSRPRRADTLTSVSLMLIGLVFFAATLFLVTELIMITLS